MLDGIDLTGKRILVTGVSAGIGVETARALVAHGATVVGAARDLDKARRATEAVAELAKTKGGFELIELDLASLKSVRAAADALVAAGKPFDVVIANAGVMMPPKGETADGFETQFGTNHLGHFVFVNRIAGLMKPGSRLVNLSSAGHRFSDVDLDDPNFARTPYDPIVGYGRSKTANILFAVEFDRRHKADGIRAAAVHPGGIRTELGRHTYADAGLHLSSRIDDDQRRARRRRQTAYAAEVGAARRGDLGLGRRGGAPADSRRALLRGLPRQRGGRRRPHPRRRRARLCPRSGARQGAVGEIRGNGRRAFRVSAGHAVAGGQCLPPATAFSGRARAASRVARPWPPVPNTHRRGYNAAGNSGVGS